MWRPPVPLVAPSGGPGRKAAHVGRRSAGGVPAGGGQPAGQVEDAGHPLSGTGRADHGHQRAGSLLREVGRHPGQELQLVLLWEHEPRSPGELARELHVEPPTARLTELLTAVRRNVGAVGPHPIGP